MALAALSALSSAPSFNCSFLPPHHHNPSKPNNSNNNLSLSLRNHNHNNVTLLRCITTTTLLLHQLGLSETQLQSHPALLSTSPHSLRARVDKLASLNITGPALHRTISHHPHLLLTSPEIDSFLDFVLQEIPGHVHPYKLERILLSNHTQLFAERVQLLLDYGIPRDKVVHIVNNVNACKVFGEMPIAELEETVVFLSRFGWPDVVLRRPLILNLDLETQLIPRVEFLVDLASGDEAGAAFLIGKLPGILAYSVEHYRSHLQFWISSVGLNKEKVFRIAQVYPNMFSVSRDRKLKPRIEFLMQCELNTDDIFKFLIKAPTFLSLSFEKNLSKKLGFLLKIGYKHRTRELALAVGAATRTSCENMQMVIALFLSYGFSCEDLLMMSKKHPQILQYSYGSLEKKMEFLIEEMDRDIGELMAFPAFLGYKLDDRIKHRYEVKKEARGKGMSLNKLLSVSAKRFELKMK